MSWRSKDLKIVLSPAGKKRAGEAALETIREQAAKGLSSTGEQTPYDWRQTGRLLSDVTVTDEGKVVFNAPYAEHVEARRPFADIAPQSQPDYEQRLQPVLRDELTFKDEV